MVCDRCGSRAYTRWRHVGHGKLELCAHHTRDHELALLEHRWVLEQDDRAELVPRLPDPSPR